MKTTTHRTAGLVMAAVALTLTPGLGACSRGTNSGLGASQQEENGVLQQQLARAQQQVAQATEKDSSRNKRLQMAQGSLQAANRRLNTLQASSYRWILLLTVLLVAAVLRAMHIGGRVMHQWHVQHDNAGVMPRTPEAAAVGAAGAGMAGLAGSGNGNGFGY